MGCISLNGILPKPLLIEINPRPPDAGSVLERFRFKRKHKSGSPTLAASLFLRLGWETADAQIVCTWVEKALALQLLADQPVDQGREVLSRARQHEGRGRIIPIEFEAG